jgi:hypothetical protein
MDTGNKLMFAIELSIERKMRISFGQCITHGSSKNLVGLPEAHGEKRKVTYLARITLFNWRSVQ